MYIGIDAGGTKIEGILFEEKKGRIIKSQKVYTKTTKKEFVNQIISLIKELTSEQKLSEIDGIGVGVPGSVNRKKGSVMIMPNLPRIRNLPLAEIIKKTFKKQVRIENDANCMAVAELHYGKGKGKQNIVCITLGTGIGAGVITQRELYVGMGNAGEIGHINISPEGYKCSCGTKGCLEEYASGRAVMRYAKKEGLKCKTPREVEDLARSGNGKAKKVYDEVGYYLGIGLSTVIKVLDPEVIILAGSISHASDLFIGRMKKEIKKGVFFKTGEIKISELKKSPAVGAASLFLK